MYAHVSDEGIVDSVGNPPGLTFEDGRWWDLRTLDTALLAQVGWYTVVEAVRPTDTATHTWNPKFTFAAGTVTQAWEQIAKTPEQLAADVAAGNQTTLLSGVAAEIIRIETQIGLANNIAGSTTSKATINGDPAAYIKDLAKMVKRIGNSSIRALRLVGDQYESASVGDTT